jgi:peptide/nickel transport system substrate-binding protein
MLLKEMARADCGGTGILHPASVGPDGKMVRPIGTGPFALGEWRRNQFVDLVRFAGYQALAGPADGNAGGKHARVDRIRFEVIPDGSAASAALLRNSLDVLDNLAANELAALHGAPGIRIDRSPTVDLYGILFQTHDPVLADPRIRRAIALSLDVAALTRVATHGTATPDSSPIPVVSPYYGVAERPLVRQNLPLARALVRASGYHGQPIELVTNRRYPQAFDSAIIVQAMAQAIGLNMQIVTLDWATQLARYAHGDYQAMIFGYSARLDPALTLDPMIGDKAADPRKVWDDPVARMLLQRATATDDLKTRQAAFDALEHLFRRDQPAVILFNTARIAAVRASVDGYHSWSGATQRLWNVGLR